MADAGPSGARPPADEAPSGEPPATAQAGADLVSIGLLVYFIALIVIVAVLLLLPVVVPQGG